MTDAVDRVELEDEREFLLGSLEDLEREHQAGDIDEHDYAALRDDYTARTARVLRALEAGEVTTAPAPPRNRRRTVLVGGAVALFAIVAGVLVAHSVGRRDPGQTITGGVRQSTTEKLNTAGQQISTDPTAAIKLYDEVLKDEPDNVEALTYKGWALTLSGSTAQGLQDLIKAATDSPTYPDVHAFLAILFFKNGLVSESARELDRLDALNPPAEMRQLTDTLRTQVNAALATSTTVTVPGTTPPAG